MRRLFFLLYLAGIFTGWSRPVPAQELTVGVVQYPPFGIIENTEPTGICPQIWEMAAADMGLTYRTIPYTSVAQALDAVAGGELDVAIGPITVTSERLHRVVFTQPFFRAEIGLLLPAEPPTAWSRIKPFFRSAVLLSCSVLLLALFIVGNLIWLFERKKNASQFPETYFQGVGNGMWFAIVTLTTVGYGDRVPVTPGGRIISGIWMVITMLTISSLTAGLASAFTIALSDVQTETLSSPTDLNGRRVAVISGTTSAQHAAEYGARLVETSSLEEAVKLLTENRVEAIVFGLPLLRYHLYQNQELPYRIAPFTLAAENYAFAVRPDTPWLNRLNIALVSLQENDEISRIESSWLK